MSRWFVARVLFIFNVCEFMLLQYVQYEELDVQHLATLFPEVVEHWGDLSVYFGSNRSTVTSELRVAAPIKTQVFDDASVPSRFAVLRFILDRGK